MTSDIKMQHGVPCGKSTEYGSVWERKVCPYNESHSVGTGSYANHIAKCRQACPPALRDKFVVCVYNATHHLLKEVYEEHLVKCADYRQYQAARFRGNPDRVVDLTYETPRDIRIMRQKHARKKQMQKGVPKEELTKVEGVEEYTEEEYEAFLKE